MKSKMILPLLLVCCLLLAACGTAASGKGSDDAVIILAQSAAALELGETTTLSYTVEPADAAITFSSADSAVATVDENGTVTAVGKGTTAITLSAGEYSKAYFEVTVSAAAMKAIPNLILGAENVELIAGSDYDLSACVINGTETVTDAPITWASSDASIASAENGKITAAAEGEAVITASAEVNGTAVEATCTVIVYPYYNITLSQNKVNSSVGGEFSLTAVVTDKDGNPVTVNEGDLKAVSSNDSIVQVTESNTFRVINIGNPGVGFTYKGNTAMIPVEIFSVTADFFSGSCKDFYGDVAGEAVCAVKFTSNAYQPTIYLTQDGVDSIKTYASENGFTSVTLRAYSILKDNAFVVGNKYWFGNGQWAENEIPVSDLTAELGFWSQSQGATEVYMIFSFR